MIELKTEIESQNPGLVDHGWAPNAFCTEGNKGNEEP
jgi:hypothetical protein